MRLIREIRMGRSIGLRKVAADTGIDLGSLSKFEHGLRGLNESNLVKLSRYYNLPINTIIQRIDKPTAVPAQATA